MPREPRTTRFTRLVIAVPRLIAEAYGAALVQAGAAAVEERPPQPVQSGAAAVEERPPQPVESGASVELVLTIEDAADAEAWAGLARSLYQAFAEQLALPLPSLALHQETVELDYHAAWLRHLTPQPLTERIVLVPTTAAEQPGRPEELRLLFEPEPAFGDGGHVTTRLAAQAVEAYCLAHTGCSVLDVGTGNGVLALVAAASGAGSALGIDVDPEAVAAASANARLNRLEHLCRFSDATLESQDGRFKLVVANLEPRVQFEVFEALLPRVEPDGALILTGFLAEQADAVQELLTTAGLPEAARREGEGYALLDCSLSEAVR